MIKQAENRIWFSGWNINWFALVCKALIMSGKLMTTEGFLEKNSWRSRQYLYILSTELNIRLITFWRRDGHDDIYTESWSFQDSFFHLLSLYLKMEDISINTEVLIITEYFCRYDFCQKVIRIADFWRARLAISWYVWRVSRPNFKK